MIDPLASLIAGAQARSGRPVPLVETRFDIAIEAGLVVVETTRRFRNAEPASIEATMTFPVPVHATLFGLTASTGGRLLTAHARSRIAAREAYEAAIDAGKGTVLHEELLRGIHMLSVGHIGPDEEIEVVTRWAAALVALRDRAHLRIPLTVGDVYGRAPLPDSDALVHGGPNGTAELAVRSSDGPVRVDGADLGGGRWRVPLEAPIDLVAARWRPRRLLGRAADGRDVTLGVEPLAPAEAALDLAIAVDHSGSMASPCTAGGTGPSVHDAVIAGLVDAARGIRPDDTVELWEFDSALARVGIARGPGNGRADQGLRHLAGLLSGPRGGTEIGAALAGILERSSARDVLLVTDGKSHELDVQALARAGRRISVVLVGEDSLEAGVGYLAALTGGGITVAVGAQAGEALASAVSALRRPGSPPAPVDGELHRVSVNRGDCALSAEWHPAAQGPGTDAFSRAVAAFAAGLALPALDAAAAADLAEAEGLVTHLTSLILVDDAAPVQDSLPATRKIRLPAPRTRMATMAGAVSLECSAAPLEALSIRHQRVPVSDLDEHFVWEAERLAPAWSGPGRHAALLGSMIDWQAAPHALASGDLAPLAPQARRLVELAAAAPGIERVARTLQLAPVALVIGLLAQTRAGRDRSAARVARALLGATPSAQLDALAEVLDEQIRLALDQESAGTG